MARRRSSRRRKSSSVIMSRVIWIAWTLITSGSVAGWMIPDMPFLGPLVQTILGNKAVNQVLNDKRVTKVIEMAPDTAWQGKVGILKKTIKQAQSTASQGTQPQVPAVNSNPRVRPGEPFQKPTDTIGIASYNIQVFGVSKMEQSWVVDTLAQIVRHFDIVAIQEIRSKEDRVLSDFVAAVNADGSRYDVVIGPRLGRTSSKEQYAFVYDTNRIEVDSSSVGTMSDPQDLLHREPLVARFRTRPMSAGTPFSFWLVNVHTDPDEVASEINVLAGVFQVMQTANPDEDDVILLGDLNASDRELGQLGQVPGISWAVTGIATNTRKTNMYDNILFSRVATTEFTGRWGVADIPTIFGLTSEQALEISDHLPVWAQFRMLESPPAHDTAQLPGFLFQ